MSNETHKHETYITSFHEKKIQSLRKELIQVAAVAVAIIEDIDYGRTDASRWFYKDFNPILREVVEERHRQDDKWGKRHLRTCEWITILTEEVGEAAQEALRITFPSVAKADAEGS